MRTGAERTRRRLTALAAALAAAMALASCGDTLQDRPSGPTALERVIVKSRFPVYWVGERFAGLEVTGVVIDPGGAVTIAYGDCLLGGQYTCVTPLSLVTSPDNSFLPGEGAPAARTAIRGVNARSTQDGRTLVLRTGGVVVSVYGHDARLVSGAARTMVPVNEAGSPGAKLPAALPDTGYDRTPLPSQLPAGAPLPR